MLTVLTVLTSSKQGTAFCALVSISFILFFIFYCSYYLLYWNIKTCWTHLVGVGFRRVPLGSPVPVPALPVPTYPHGFVNPIHMEAWQSLSFDIHYLTTLPVLLQCWGLGLAWKVQFQEQKSLIILRTNPNGLKRSRRLLTLSLTVALYSFRVATIYFVQILNLLWPRIANTCEFPLIHRFLTHRSESSMGKSPHRSGCDLLRCPKNLWVWIWVTHECTRAQPYSHMYAAGCKAYPHKNIGTFTPISIACASSTKVQFSCSATPFWDDEYGPVVCRSIPCLGNQRFRLSFTNSVPWSHRKALGCMPLARRWVT